ncbi:hypothetical protein LBMAG53_09490 [Planctomycetota bacterium]|nr:hypothetical protein LBMAG53_09490 [Planctomycetota bacterium]
MHLAAVVLLALAGLLAGWSAWLRWTGLGTSAADDRGRAWVAALWAAFACLTAGLLASLVEAGHRDFCYFVLAVWAAVAAALFVGRSLSTPSLPLLMLPIAAVALLLAMAGFFRLGAGQGDLTRLGGTPVIVWIHVGFMLAAMAVLLVAGAAGALYLVARRALKRDSGRGLRLPPLPLLEQLTERAVVVGTALLSAGIATGGAAMQISTGFTLVSPAALIGLGHLVVLLFALGLRATGRLPRHRLATVAVVSLALSAAGGMAVLVLAHGL